MTAQERKSIFAFCRELGMSDDDRHALIYSITGKESTTELTPGETKSVIHELTERLKLKNRTKPLEERKPRAYRPRVPGMMTPEQQSLAWRLVYRLMELDGVAADKSMAGKRMAGAIRKELGITTVEGEHIFEWVNFENGAKLIEKLKMYVRSAERRVKRTGS
ncbi:MAG: regulatory protein GemA [Oscillospiraceae bacterium]